MTLNQFDKQVREEFQNLLHRKVPLHLNDPPYAQIRDVSIDDIQSFYTAKFKELAEEILKEVTLDRVPPFDYEKSDYDAAYIVMDKEKVGYNNAIDHLESKKQQILNED